MILIDSSVVIALFRVQEKHHLDAKQILQNTDKNKLIITDFVISEILTVLKMRESHSIAIRCLDFLTNNENISIYHTSKQEFNDSQKFFIKNNNKLSFVDTLLLIICKNNNYNLATFDKDLGNLLKKSK